MMTDEDRKTAAMVLGKCAANDPWFPVGGEALVLGWAEVFAASGLTRDDLLAGVARAYRLAPDGFKPLPAAIVKHARAAYSEALAALPEQKRQDMETAYQALQDLGWSPPRAHRYVRRVALGRDAGALSEGDRQGLAAAFAERAALVDAEPRRLSLQAFLPRVPNTR